MTNDLHTPSVHKPDYTASLRLSMEVLAVIVSFATFALFIGFVASLA